MILFSTHQGRDGQFYWNAKSVNGAIVADGGEGYATRQNARRAARRLIASIAEGDYELTATERADD